MRILYVVSLFPCWSETFIVREIATLVAAGIDIRILSLKPPTEKFVQPEASALIGRVHHPRAWPLAVLAAMGAAIRHPGLSIAAARIAWRLRRQPVAMAKSIAALTRGMAALGWIEAFDPNLVHAHWATYPSTVAMALAQAIGKPFGFTAHAHDIFVDDHLLGEKLARARVPVTISRYNVEWLAEWVDASARARLTVVHCGVDLSSSTFRREGREDDLIVAVGRLDPIKGLDVLIEALAQLAADGVAFRCRIIGEGPQQAELEAAIARHHLGDRITLLGARPQAAVRDLLHAATCFVLPSVVCTDGNRDGIPVALMEAMAAGAPVVSTFVSGIPELVADGEEGLLVAERDPTALAAALRRILADRGLRENVSRAARAKVEREFDAAVETAKLLGLFRRAVRAG